MSLSLIAESPPLWKDADGVIRVGGTRVTLDTLVEAFREGMTVEAIVEQYPPLVLGDAYAAIAYYLRHRDAVDEYLRDRMQLAAKVQGENEERFSPVGVRDRLLARRLGRG